MNYVIKSTSPCFETIKAVDGRLEHLAFHQARFDKTRQALFGTSSKMMLAEHLNPPKDSIYRVRVEYTSKIEKVSYMPYEPRVFKRFSLVECAIDYQYKYCDRDALEAYACDVDEDIIFTCKDVLQDTRIANIALLIDGQWWTPAHPLLEGTTRERLLASGFLKEAFLTRHSLQKAEKFAIMNALIGFKIIHNVFIKD